MAKKYKDLKAYLNDAYYDLLCSAVEKEILRKQKAYNISSYRIPYPNIDDTFIDNVTITSLYTEVKPDDYVRILCNVSCEVTFKGFASGRRRNDVDEDSKIIWLRVILGCRFNEEFEDLKVVSIKPLDEKEKFVLSQSSTPTFIPYMDSDSLDQYATEFLKKYCPEALIMPMALPIKKVIKAMGLRVVSGTPKDGSFGRCYFVDKKTKDKAGNEKIIRKGTIMYNPESVFFNGIGCANNTIIHECVHWEYHRKFFALMKLLDPSLAAIHCKVVEDIRGNRENSDDYHWMEWQANALTPRILMPADMMKLKYEEIKGEIIASGVKHLPEVYKQTISRLADFFQVTVTSVKIRLLELGFNYLKGIYDYAGQTPTKPYLYNPKKIQANQTFAAGLSDVITSANDNNDLKNCLALRTIVYTGGFFVINNKKYTYKDPLTGRQELTDYALEHMDECCLVFDCEPKKKVTFDDRYYSMCFLCRGQPGQNPYAKTVKNNDLNNGIMRRSIELCDALAENDEALALVAQFEDGFAHNLGLLMERYGVSNRELKRTSTIDDHKIAAFVDGSKEPSRTEVLAIIAALQLYPVVAEALFTKAGFTFRATKQDQAYKFLMNHYYEEGLEVWNQSLRDEGMVDWQLP